MAEHVHTQRELLFNDLSKCQDRKVPGRCLIEPDGCQASDDVHTGTLKGGGLSETADTHRVSPGWLGSHSPKRRHRVSQVQPGIHARYKHGIGKSSSASTQSALVKSIITGIRKRRTGIFAHAPISRAKIQRNIARTIGGMSSREASTGILPTSSTSFSSTETINTTGDTSLHGHRSERLVDFETETPIHRKRRRNTSN